MSNARGVIWGEVVHEQMQIAEEVRGQAAEKRGDQRGRADVNLEARAHVRVLHFNHGGHLAIGA